MAAAFGPAGALAGAVPGFVPRSSQREFALAVFDAIAERGTLIVEAGTGTGKTFAYLVPALLAGGKVLVSTATRALQDQVFRKDLALLRAALRPKLEVALLKGRQNYVCLHRLARAELEGAFASRREVAQLRSIVRFTRTSLSGDRSELAEIPESAPIWSAVTSTRDNCLGTECPRYDECFVYKARRAALAADVVVVNHHLFLADLAMRDDAIREFLPAADTVILDEAHQLPKIAGDFFGIGFSLAQMNELAADVLAVGLQAAADGADWSRLAGTLEQAGREVRLVLAEAGLKVGERLAWDRLRAQPGIAAALEQLDAALAALAAPLQSNAERAAELGALHGRVAALRGELAGWRDSARRDPSRENDAPPDDSARKDDSLHANDSPRNDRSPRTDEAALGGEQDAAEFVRWVQATAHSALFHTTPLALGPAFARLREQQTQAWILTSATLTLAGRFDRYVRDIGLEDAATHRWPSPFDFARQALLYLPQPMPSPLAADFPEQVAELAWPVIEACGGRTFVLCTTLRAVARVAERLRRHLHESGADLPLLEQGTTTRSALLEAFRRAGNAVLVGSVSFWEGIDVRGEALSLVVIDKLPFAPPDDPVVDARVRRLRALGRNAFTEFQLPQAVTLLQQGVGRLIRDETDRGVLMILDDRLLTKSYGKTVLASLPPFSRTRRLEDACEFFRET
ncbi:MAG TPA: ATP-dependent DNA helicase [Burkholderiaceae bacterium]|nr:ATP-dependent DNA helicase [Burkholderiaceae bacterium]